jgi:hypothetical protein
MVFPIDILHPPRLQRWLQKEGESKQKWVFSCINKGIPVNAHLDTGKFPVFYSWPDDYTRLRAAKV